MEEILINIIPLDNEPNIIEQIMIKQKARGGRRPGAGRRKLPEDVKKVEVRCWISGAALKAIGGTHDAARHHLEQYAELQTGPDGRTTP